MAKTSDTLLVSVDFSNGKDNSVLVVGRKLPNQSVNIINAFKGDDAIRMYELLITQIYGAKGDANGN